MPNKHFIVTPDGVKHTRTSQNRRYTYAVVAQISKVAARDYVYHPDLAATHTRNYQHYQKVASGQHSYSHLDNADARAEAAAEIEGCDTPAAYVDKYRAAALEGIEALDAKGYYTKWCVVGWCSRDDLAQKLQSSTAAKRYYHNVRIIPVQIKE